MTARVVIIGGGVAGLYAAWRLRQAGIDDVVILEARDRLGGRIETAPPGVDLGATWYWSSMQSGLARVMAELGLKDIPQYGHGMDLLDLSRAEPAQPAEATFAAPAAKRLQGGMVSLIHALAARLEPATLKREHTVQRIYAEATTLHVQATTPSGDTVLIEADHVLLALPPRLAARNIAFEPDLPDVLKRQWQRIGTWMAPHAKYIAVYATPFWREKGLSGHIRSAAGPLAEVHDASPEGGAALFGFVGMDAIARRRVRSDPLKALCRQQLTRLLGPSAATPLMELLRDWSTEPFTATDADQHPSSFHVVAPSISRSEPAWFGRLIPIGSEWSELMPGYIAGAIDAADHGIALLLTQTKEPSA